VQSVANHYYKGCGLSFYQFPTDSCRHGKDWQPSDYSWVCSAHFVNGKKSDDPLSPDYVPSAFAYVCSPHKQKMKRQLERYTERVHTKKRCLENLQRKTALIDMSGAESLIHNCTSTSTSTESDSGGTGVSTQTDPVTSADASTSTSTQCEVTMTDMTGSYLEALEQECLQATRRSIGKQSQWSQSAFEHDNNKVKFYTGLPCFSILLIMYNFVSSQVNYTGEAHVLSKFEEFIATVMKLRLSLFNQDIAYRFGVH